MRQSVKSYTKTGREGEGGGEGGGAGSAQIIRWKKPGID